MEPPPEDALRGWLEHLDDGTDTAEPPADLRERILAAARNEPQQQRRRRWWAWQYQWWQQS